MCEEIGHRLPLYSFSFSEELKLETIKLIGDHFSAKKIMWFNEYHCLKVAGHKPKYKALLGGNDGPTRKMA